MTETSSLRTVVRKAPFALLVGLLLCCSFYVYSELKAPRVPRDMATAYRLINLSWIQAATSWIAALFAVAITTALLRQNHASLANRLGATSVFATIRAIPVVVVCVAAVLLGLAAGLIPGLLFVIVFSAAPALSAAAPQRINALDACTLASQHRRVSSRTALLTLAPMVVHLGTVYIWYRSLGPLAKPNVTTLRSVQALHITSLVLTACVILCGVAYAVLHARENSRIVET